MYFQSDIAHSETVISPSLSGISKIDCFLEIARRSGDKRFCFIEFLLGDHVVDVRDLEDSNGDGHRSDFLGCVGEDVHGVPFVGGFYYSPCKTYEAKA